MKADAESGYWQCSQNEHISVLADTLAGLVTLPQDAVLLDATVGHGGHSLLFGKNLGPDGMIIGLDVDEKCIKRAQLNLAGLDCKVVLVRENFAKIAEVVSTQGTEKVDFVLADLGFCSSQIADPEKGLSFQQDMKLDMRIDERLTTTAADIVNGLSEKELADLIYKYGQERASRKISRFIVGQRHAGPITTTAALAATVCRALNVAPNGWRAGKIHPATRTFQALRIAVNDELENLKRLLEDVPALLRKNGLFAVISFHSLEDRLVKMNFRENAGNGIYEVLTKKPLTAMPAEVAANPRARSAKLRVARRR